jgi:ribosomal protein S8E
MAVTYHADVKTERITATRDYFADGTLEILTAADVLLVSFGLSAGGGSIAGAVWTLAFDAGTVAAAASGTAAKAQIKRSAANGSSAHLTGLTVGTSGTDIILDSTSITAAQNVTLSSATITHA